MSIIIPAHNEASVIGSCLSSILSQTFAKPLEVLVGANACSDETVELLNSYEERFAQRGFDLVVLDIAEGGKTNAMNHCDRAASGHMRCYLDADIVCSPGLFQSIYEALNRSEPAFASGTMVIPKTKSWVSNAYAAFWKELPFLKRDVPGAGLYCVNEAGRTRWQEFPDTFSDDTFVRLQFMPSERFRVKDEYEWPITAGFRELKKVRRRQDLNTIDIHGRYPNLVSNEGQNKIEFLKLFNLSVKNPQGFFVYSAVKMLNYFSFKNDKQFRSRN